MCCTLRTAILLFEKSYKKGKQVGENLNTWSHKYFETESVKLTLMFFVAYQLDVVHLKPRGSVKQI